MLRRLLAFSFFGIVLVALVVVWTLVLQKFNRSPGAASPHAAAPVNVWRSANVRVEVGDTSGFEWTGRENGVLTSRRLLRVELKITNLSPTHLRDYAGFDQAFIATLTDEHGNFYEQWLRPHPYAGERIHPSSVLTDPLIFEAPVAAATKLRLTINAAAWGEVGFAELHFPVPSPKK